MRGRHGAFQFVNLLVTTRQGDRDSASTTGVGRPAGNGHILESDTTIIVGMDASLRHGKGNLQLP
jgi:hypothetical protein